MEKFFNNLEKPGRYALNILSDICWIMVSLFITISLIGELGSSWLTPVFLIIIFAWFLFCVACFISNSIFYAISKTYNKQEGK